MTAHVADPARTGRRRSRPTTSAGAGTRAGRRVRQVVAAVVALVALAPIIALVVSAFRPATETFVASWPSSLTAEAFGEIWNAELVRYMANSTFVSATVTVLALWFHSMAGFALARMRFPGRGIMFGAIISTLLISLPVVLVPTFLLVKELGLLDSYAGLIIPAIFNAFGVFWLRQFYLGIPDELEDAARADGCGWFGIWWHVAVPLSRPVLASLAVLFFLANWNSYLWPLTILSDRDTWTVQVGIASLQGQYAADYNLIMAASLIVAVPTIVLFLIFQRQIVESFKNAGLK